MTWLDAARKAGFIELAPRANGFAALWHVAGKVTNVAESDDFDEVLARAKSWAQSEGVPLVRGLH
jgi:hypothetical protein